MAHGQTVVVYHTPPQQPRRPRQPQPRDPADAGSPASRGIAWLIATIVAIAVILVQNVPPALDMMGIGAKPADAAAEQLPEEDTAPPEVIPPGYTPFDLSGRYLLKARWLARYDRDPMAALDPYAITDADRVRAVVVAAEIESHQDAIDRIDRIAPTIDPSGPLTEDLWLLRTLYNPELERTDSGAARDRLTPEEQDRLVEHHGYFGEVALTAGLPETDPDRQALLSGGGPLLATLFGFLAIIALGGVFGLIAFITAIVLVALGKIRPRMPIAERGGSIYLETFALFVGGFLLVIAISTVLETTAPEGATWPFAAQLGMQWCLALTPLWPLFRGVPLKKHLRALGLHTGQGVFKEIGCGILGYLAGVPLFVLGIIITLVLTMVVSVLFPVDEAAAPENPIFELLGAGPLWAVLLTVSLIVVWAPLVEETIFRGGLHRHLRSRLPFPIATLGTACLFAFMHGYGPVFVFPLIGLGTTFSIMREWRGSLIAPITAHFLHNGTIVLLVISLVKTL